MNTMQNRLNTKLARRQAHKHNYFVYRWRVQDEFNTAIERLNYHIHLHAGDYRKTLLNERLLANYKGRYASCLKSNMLTELIKDTWSFLIEQREASSEAMQSEIAYSKAMSQLIDNAFSILLACSVEFNTLLGFSELYIVATEPEIIVVNASSPKRSESIVSVRARLSTSFFSLVIQGDKNKIQFFLMPVEEIMGLGSSGSLRLPTVQFIAHLTEGKEVLWQLEGQKEGTEITQELLEEICIKCLKELVDATKAVMVKAERIT